MATCVRLEVFLSDEQIEAAERIVAEKNTAPRCSSVLGAWTWRGWLSIVAQQGINDRLESGVAHA